MRPVRNENENETKSGRQSERHRRKRERTKEKRERMKEKREREESERRVLKKREGGRRGKNGNGWGGITRLRSSP